MASDVDICNLALGHLANEANITSLDPPDALVEADHCARFYPIARDAMLEMHAWGFATRRATLALLTDDPPAQFAFTYALPNGIIRPLALLDPGSTSDNDTRDFLRESLDGDVDVIYTNAETATLKYIARVTNTAKFTPLFVVALSKLLAAYLAGPLLRDMKLARAKYEEFLQVDFPAAAGHDANSQQSHPYRTEHLPDFLAARR